MNKTIRIALGRGGGVLLLVLWSFPASLLAQKNPAATPSSAAVRRLILWEAVALALQNNREVHLAEVTVSRAAAEHQEARAIFRPQIFAGTGLAATKGFPLSIEGSAPSIFQVSSAQALFNPSLRNLEKQAGEMRAAAEKSLEEKRDDIVAATVLTYLDLDRSRRSLEYVRGQTQSLREAEGVVAERTRAGLEPPLESTRAKLATARSHSQTVALENQIALLEFRLRDLVGISQSQTILTEPAQVPAGGVEADVERLVSLALENNPGLQALEEEIRAKEFQVRSEEGTRWPRINLVGQYGLFSDINNFSQFFRKFTRNNATVGVSIQVPLYDRNRRSARLSKAEAELAAARYRWSEARAGISRQVREQWSEAQQQSADREVVRLELELARKSLDASLARFQEGRVNLLAVGQARLEENRSWVNLFQTEYQAEKARLELLRITGQIRSVFQ